VEGRKPDFVRGVAGVLRLAGAAAHAGAALSRDPGAATDLTEAGDLLTDAGDERKMREIVEYGADRAQTSVLNVLFGR